MRRSASSPVAVAPAPPLEPLLTVTEAAGILRVRPQAIRNLCASGQLGYFRIGLKILLRPGDLSAFLTTARQEPRG